MSDLTLTTPVTETARHLLAAQMEIIYTHADALSVAADVTGVHEMRKAIRRSFTVFVLFAPYFQPNALPPFQRPLRKMMKRLGRARDLTVLGQNLDQHIQMMALHGEDAGNLHTLRHYIHAQQSAAELRFQARLQPEKVHHFFQDYYRFLNTPGAGVPPLPPYAPFQLRHLLPVLIYQRLATVLAFADHLSQATLPELHQLRLRAKELRYTLEFFAPLMGPTFTVAYAVVTQMLEHMGTQNDAYVAAQWLSRQNLDEATPALRDGINQYQAILRQQLDQLLAEFPPIWAEFDDPAWRVNLALSLPG